MRLRGRNNEIVFNPVRADKQTASLFREDELRLQERLCYICRRRSDSAQLGYLALGDGYSAP